MSSAAAGVACRKRRPIITRAALSTGGRAESKRNDGAFVCAAVEKGGLAFGTVHLLRPGRVQVLEG